VPKLVTNGHEVIGMTRSEAKADAVRALGAEPAIADALDPDGVAAVVAANERQALPGAELRGLALRAQRRPDQGRGGAARRRPARLGPADDRGDPPPRAGG
jgi:nucleoside-diphosphate-sugar epimerase